MTLLQRYFNVEMTVNGFNYYKRKRDD